jgi:subtilisin family serine protease
MTIPRPIKSNVISFFCQVLYPETRCHRENDVLLSHRYLPFLVSIAAFMISFYFISYAHAAEIVLRPHWVFYTQKKDMRPISISQRALERRAGRSSLSDFSTYDTPPNLDYIRQTENAGGKIRVISRWLNAVSIEADSAALDRIAGLPFVANIQPISSSTFSLPILENPASHPAKTAVFDYGPSYAQDSMLAIDSLHNMGLSGEGVLIGIMDTGFDTSHVAFATMRSENRIIATHDFINGDDDVMDTPDEQQSHGTAVFSILGGFYEGALVGPAFGAEYVLAKTEDLSGETRAEEDYWVAAAEWMDSLGVDIISSSVGYTDWYNTSQLDGDTPIITRAADIAVSLGIIVVNCAGNEGQTSWHKIIPPADGDSVIAAGGVDKYGIVAPFSSRGPTADGRIKPDFCALGSGVYLANYIGGYAFMSGTSFAAPLIAGGIALLLEGYPEWDYYDIISALKQSSDHSNQPDNDYGWGIPNFVKAFNYTPYRPTGKLSIRIAPNPAINSAVIYLKLPANDESILAIYDISGAPVGEWTFRTSDETLAVQTWDGRNADNKQVASGIYICILKSRDDILRYKFAYIIK